MFETKTRAVTTRAVAILLGVVALLGAAIAYWSSHRIDRSGNTLASARETNQHRQNGFLSEDTLPSTLQNEIGMRFNLIRRGFFRMGSAAKNANDNEQPERFVMITRPFYLGTYEVTQNQWQQVMGSGSVYSLPGHDSEAGDRPVEGISWETAQSFIRRLNTAEGGALYRLPTEAEWEYAARAGSSSIYSFGDNPQLLTGYGWYSQNADRQPHPVGQLRPNTWGLYDMYGNVSEWVHDWYGPYDLDHTLKDPKDPAGPKQGTYHVIRGGSWLSNAHECRSARRIKKLPGHNSLDVGFRLVRVLN